MLFHKVHAPDSGVYFEQLSCTIRGDMDVPAFLQAWQQVTDRHPILRTSFIWEDVREPVQAVSRQVTLPVERLDWQEFSPAEGQQQLETFLQADRQRGFQLNRAPLMRLTPIQLASDSCEFVWSHHHLLLDGWSIPLLLEEVFKIYRASLKGEKLALPRPRPYQDYIVWIQQQNLSAAESFWRGRLAGFAAPTRLPAERDLSQKAHREERYEEREIRVGSATTAALQTLARQQQLTLNTLVQGAWGLLLSR